MSVSDLIHLFLSTTALGLELLGVAVIVVGVLSVTISKGIIRNVFQASSSEAHKRYKHSLAKPLLLGLDLLVAADIVRTVAVEPTFANVAVLGALVLVRTFLSWSMAVEVEGHWPWTAPEEPQSRSQAAKGGA